MTRHGPDRQDRSHLAGWSWLCPCGWSTDRHRLPEMADGQRQAHIRWHDHQATAPLASTR